MNAKRIIKIIRNLSSNEEDADKLLVKAFIMQHPILQIWESNIFHLWETEVVANAEDNSTIELLSTLPDMSIENLIECFESLVSTDEKKEKGITYSEEFIIIRNTARRWTIVNDTAYIIFHDVECILIEEKGAISLIPQNSDDIKRIRPHFNKQDFLLKYKGTIGYSSVACLLYTSPSPRD